jgi:tripartite ATP-independent transporter DctM subunit
MDIAFAVFLGVLVLVFVLRMPIPLGFFSATVVYLIIKGMPISLAAEDMVNGLYGRYVVMAVPLFIFTANVMNTGTVTEKVFEVANHLVGRAAGGLAHVNVIASLIFSGMTGSAMADAAGLGNMEIKAMHKAGYTKEFAAAVTAASAVIGPVFPPSIPMVLYSMLSGASIGKLFLGGMVPGVLIAFALMIYIALVAKRRGFPRGKPSSLAAFLRITIISLPALLTPVILLGGIYGGVMTPTEAGAVAGLYSLIVSIFVYRALGPKGLLDVIVTTVRQTGTISIIIGASAGLSFVIANERIPDHLAVLLTNITTNRDVFLLIINLIFIALGTIANQNVIMLVFVPIVLPAVAAMHIDPVHFGVVIVVNKMIGLTTPPYGGLLFVTSAVSGTPLPAIVREIWPMLIMLFIVLFLITYVPATVMMLPNAFG